MEEKKQYDLEDRTLRFSKNVIDLINKASKNLSNNEIVKQLIRSAGSGGENYIEANEALGKKDFVMHVRIARKEAKESRYWLQLLDCAEPHQPLKEQFIQESTELLKILSRIIEKSL